MLGSSEAVINGKMNDNMTYFSPNVGVHNLVIGFGTTVNQDLTVRNNYAVGGLLLLDVGWWQSLTMADNSLFGATSGMIWLRDSPLTALHPPNNPSFPTPST